MTEVVTHQFDAIHTSHDLICEGYIRSEIGLFIGNTLMIPGKHIKIYHLIDAHVPQILQKQAVTDATIGNSIASWYQFAYNAGFVSSLDELFPSRFINFDFDREDLNEQLEADVAILQDAVNVLDATFSTDSERVAAVTSLQLQIDTALADRVLIRQEIDADVLVELNRAEAQEAAIRSEFVAADDAIKGPSVADEYNTLKKIEEIVKAEIAENDSDFVIERARTLLLENRYTDIDVDQ